MSEASEITLIQLCSRRLGTFS